MEREYCVYKHTSPNGKVYIGITSMQPERRWNNGVGYSRNNYFYRAITKYGWKNFQHEILYRGLSEQEAEFVEHQLIAEYKSNDSRYGYNHTDGGEIGKHYSDDSIAKMKKAKEGKYAGKNNPRYGVEVSDETRKKISERLKGKFAGEKNPNYGKTLSDDQKAAIAKSHTGKHYPRLSESLKKSEAHRAAIESRMKMIDQFTIDGKYIGTWRSARDAGQVIANSERGQSNICWCANGHLKTAYGFRWAYSSRMQDKGGLP